MANPGASIVVQSKAYKLPSNCVYKEILKIDGDRENTDIIATMGDWMARGRDQTMMLANQEGYGKALLPREIEDPANIGAIPPVMIPNPLISSLVTLEQNDVARLFLDARFKGNLVKRRLKVMMQANNYNACDIFAMIDSKYSAMEPDSGETDAQMQTRMSSLCLKALRAAAPMAYQVMDHQPIIWDKITLSNDSNMSYFLNDLEDEVASHDLMYAGLQAKMTSSDIDTVVTAPRLLGRIKGHPQINSMAYMTDENMARLGACKLMFSGIICMESNQDNCHPSPLPGYKPTIRSVYNKHASRSNCRDAYSKQGSESASVHGLRTGSEDLKDQAKAIKNRCPHWFYGNRGCKFEETCKKNHGPPGTQGILGEWKNPKDRNYRRSEDEEERSPKRNKSSPKDPRTCYGCGEAGHFILDCPRKKKEQEKRQVNMNIVVNVRSPTDTADAGAAEGGAAASGQGQQQGLSRVAMPLPP